MVDSKIYQEWLVMAKKDLNSAQILFDHDADYGIVCFHLQQTIEKYLKGFIIRRSGLLESGHSLVKLGKKAAIYDPRLGIFLKDLAFLSIYYLETRYPAEDPLLITHEDVKECFTITLNLISRVDEIIHNQAPPA